MKIENNLNFEFKKISKNSIEVQEKIYKNIQKVEFFKNIYGEEVMIIFDGKKTKEIILNNKYSGEKQSEWKDMNKGW